MAKEKKKGGQVLVMKDRIQERIKVLVKEVAEKREKSEDPKADKELRATHKQLKRLQRKLSRMVALEKRADSRVKKPEEKKAPEEAKEKAAEKEDAKTEEPAGSSEASA